MSHLCHWRGCKKEVDPKFWGCPSHWFALPKALRDRIWATYRAGQETTKDPSIAYLAAADAVQKWIREATTVACGDCGGPTKLREGQHGLFYSCVKYPRCDGGVSAHATGLPMGKPADKATRIGRRAAHAAFDLLWQRGGLSRHEAYAWMRKAMGLTKDEAHIGNFTTAQCEQLRQLLRERPSQMNLMEEPVAPTRS